MFNSIVLMMKVYPYILYREPDLQNNFLSMSSPYLASNHLQLSSLKGIFVNAKVLILAYKISTPTPLLVCENARLKTAYY